MANVDEVSKLKVEQLKELAAEHGVEVLPSDKKDELVLKVADGVTPEQFEAYKANQPDNSAGEPENTSEDASESGEPQSDVTPVATEGDVKDAENADAAAKDQTHKEAAAEVDSKPGASAEEDAAKRAGVAEERLAGGEHDALQNRAPKNGFEEENQKATETERKAAQKASNMATKERVEKSPTPSEVAQQDAENTASTNQGSEIAAAIREGLKDAKGGNFKLSPDAGVNPRFSVVKNKDGEVLLRENETGHLSKLQLKSIEEQEASIQGQEVEEV